MKLATIIYAVSAHILAKAVAVDVPTAQTLNGTYGGVYSASFDQDFFLGMPYLQLPERFHPANTLTASWNGTIAATSYAPSCVGYESSVDASSMSEDCLYLNVVRPHMESNSTSLVPVVVYFHGGGFWGGSASEDRYNLSFIVQKSVNLGQPIIAVSFNYRLSAWGFLFSNELRDTGATNVGLRDQRFALAWIQENISGFGGDPAKVTLWGQDAGASSIGFQITAYSGRNDSLLRAAIMESGNPTPIQGLNGTQFYQPLYDQLTMLVKPSEDWAESYGMTSDDTCWVSPDRMACLRNATFVDINDAINSTSPRSWFPVIDGDIVTEQPSRSLYTGKFVPAPIIIGASTDEGSYYMPSAKITTDADFGDLVANPQFWGVPPGIALPRVLANQLFASYQTVSSSPTVKANAYQGDATINANRRQACQTYAKRNISAYCYRFNVPLYNQTTSLHGDELPFVFSNREGHGYVTNPLSNPSLVELASDISSNWISFITALDPNAWRDSSAITPEWPTYGSGYEIVFEGNGTSFVEEDTWRTNQTTIILGPPSGIAVAYQR